MSGGGGRTDAFLEANLAALARALPRIGRPRRGSERARARAADQAASGEPSAPGSRTASFCTLAAILGRRLAGSSGRSWDRPSIPLVLLGLGLGYAAEACLESEVPRLIACEADPGALAAAFRLRDLSRLLADERLGFVVGGEPEALISALELSGGTRASVLEIKAATSTDPSGSSARGGPPSAGTPRAKSTRTPCADSGSSGCATWRAISLGRRPPRASRPLPVSSRASPPWSSPRVRASIRFFHI